MSHNNYCVADSIREFLKYLASANLLDGFSREAIPPEHKTGMSGAVIKSYLKKDPCKNFDYILTKEGRRYLKVWLL